MMSTPQISKSCAKATSYKQKWKIGGTALSMMPSRRQLK
jgi:hypothetical protein